MGLCKYIYTNIYTFACSGDERQLAGGRETGRERQREREREREKERETHQDSHGRLETERGKKVKKFSRFLVFLKKKKK